MACAVSFITGKTRLADSSDVSNPMGMVTLMAATMRTWQYVGQADGTESGWWTLFVEGQLPVDAIDPLAAQLDHICDVVQAMPSLS